MKFSLLHESGVSYTATVKTNGGIVLKDDKGETINTFAPAAVKKIGTPEEFLTHRYLTKKSDKFWWKKLTAI